MTEMANRAATTTVAAPSLLVACLCADWCNVCQDYRSRFEQVMQSLKAEHPQIDFVWVDIEDEDHLLHPLDVDNFPTVLLARGDTPQFFGAIAPMASTLERLVRKHLNEGPGLSLNQVDVSRAVLRIRAAKLG